MPGTANIFMCIDAWWYKPSLIQTSLRFRFNKPYSSSTQVVFAYFFGVLPPVDYVAGSVKMGQPIRHPHRRLVGISSTLTGHPQTRDATVLFFDSTPPIEPYVILAATFVKLPGQPLFVVSPVMKWRQLQRRSATGGYTN